MVPATVCIIPAVVCIIVFVVFRGLPVRGSEKSARLGRWGILAGVTPGLLLLGLFYSLAWHMHQSLGAWPSSIGERGFPTGLQAHARIAGGYYGMMLLATLLVWPVAFAGCGFYRPWRRAPTYLAIHVLCFALSNLLMSLAPVPFLDWWVD